MNSVQLWPYVGLVICVFVTIIAFYESRGGRYVRLMAKLALPAYTLHQFEEHGIDILGQKYAFQKHFCNVFGYAPTSCPCDDLFILAVNVGAVWIFCGICFIFWSKSRLLAASYGVILVNAAIHIAWAVAQRAYNPGLLTAVTLFVPLSTWMLFQLYTRRCVSTRDIAEAVLIGLLVHAWLVVTLKLRSIEMISYPAFISAQVPIGLLPYFYSRCLKVE